MPIGTSDGEYFDDHYDYVSRRPVINPNEDPRFMTRDQNEVTPTQMGINQQMDQAEQDPTTGTGIPIGLKRVEITGGTIDSRMPPEASTEPAGALNSGEGGQVPGNVDWTKMNQPFGSLKSTSKEDTPTVATAAGGLIKITEGDIEQATNVAMGAGPAMIAGVKGLAGLNAAAKGEALTKLGHAQVLEGQAANADDIWQQTGFFRGADGRWKYEIPDEGAKLKESGFHKNIIPDDPRVGGETNLTYSVKPGLKVGDILDHPELFKTYPHLKDIAIREHTDPKVIGSASLRDNALSFREDLDPEYLRGVLLHELQHFVQDHEGFARGSGSRAFLPEKFDYAMQRYQQALEEGADPKSESMQKAKKMINDAWSVAMEKYQRVMGEVEARNVQTRRDFNEVKRHYNSPRSTEDKPRFVQIDPANPPSSQNMEMNLPGLRITEPRSPRWPLNDNAKPLNEFQQFIKDYDELVKLREGLGTPTKDKRFGNLRHWSDLDYAKYNKAGREFAKKHGQTWEDVKPLDLT